MKNSFQAGVGRAIITPPLGAILFGYAPGRPAESINDDLKVTCIALAEAGRQAMLISADLCIYSQEGSDRLRRNIADRTGIPFANIIFSLTHTHSGPTTVDLAGWGTEDAKYNLEIFEPAALKAAQAAVDNLEPAELGVATIQSDVGINRRQLNRDGSISLGQNPWAPYDPTMTVISLRAQAGEPLVNLIHYCSHSTAAGVSPEVTRDWSGPMVDSLEEESGAISVFFNGAEGDVGPRLANGRTTGDLQAALALGAKAGFAAVQAWRSIKEYRPASLGVISGEIKLPVQDLPEKDQVLAALAELGDPAKLKGMEKMKHSKWQKVVAELEKDTAPARHRVLAQSIVAFGPVAFVPFPFEMFVEITLRIRQLSPFQHTLCLSNTNGSYGYFPTKDQFPRGGYEIASARLVDVDAYVQTEDADDHAVEENLQLLEKLARDMEN